MCCSAFFRSIDDMSIPEIRDSKLITNELERESIFEVLQGIKGLVYKVSVIGPEVIDDINILQATMKGMRESCHSCIKDSHFNPGSDQVIALIDSNRVPEDMPEGVRPKLLSVATLSYTV